MRLIYPLIFLAVHTVVADIAVTVDARKELHLTVYRDFGVVKDSRNINIPEGANRIRFEGVATGIDAKSVNLDWKSGNGVELIGQSYEFDLVSPVKLMEKYVGREIEIIPRKDQWFDTSLQVAELISMNGKEPVFRIGTKITFGDIGRILFPYMPDNLYTKPTLVWNVFIAKRQKTEITATYLSEGFSWEAAYMLQIGKNDKQGSFSGLISLQNESGLDCKNAQVTFVSGAVRRVVGIDAAEAEMAGHSGNKYGNYSFYALNQRVTIFTNHSKQIEWIPRVPVNFKKNYFAEINAAEGTVATPVTVYSTVEVENAENNGLGIPLPEGVVRVFMEDESGNRRFVGENRVANTKIGQSFFAPLGSTDGIDITQKVESDGESYQVFIKNNRKHTISLKMHAYIGNRKVTGSSAKYRIVYGSSLEWNIDVKSKTTYKLTYNLK